MRGSSLKALRGGAKQGASIPQRRCLSSRPRRRRLEVRALFDEMESFTNLMSPGAASVVTAVIAATSVSLNLYGNLLTERKRADLAKQVERERQAALQVKEMKSMVVYTLFTLAQFLGFVELVRREGPRERSFLQQGNPQGTDTLANLLEGFRFVMCAHPAALQAWYDEGDHRDHPGARSRPGVPYNTMVGLVATPGGWSGLQPFPVNRWSRLLLLQQLLVDTLDLLDPFYVRTPEQHRWRLAPTPYKPLPNAESYVERLRMLETMVDPAMSSVFLRAGWSRGGKDGRDTGGSHSSATDYLPGGPTGQLGAGDRLYSMQPASGGGGGSRVAVGSMSSSLDGYDDVYDGMYEDVPFDMYGTRRTAAGGVPTGAAGPGSVPGAATDGSAPFWQAHGSAARVRLCGPVLAGSRLTSP
eukprot:XP_001689694.1 predicted protein [Chlamydomonas reinhardtii]